MSSTPPFQADSLLAHARALRALARALSWDEASAEDLVQETWLTALEKQPQPGAGLAPWLRAVMRRRAAHRQRSEAARSRREKLVSLGETDLRVEDRKSIVSALAQELMQLDEPYQTTLFLRFFEERSVLEIAREYDTTTGTVGSRIHRGLEALRTRLDARSRGSRDYWLSALAPFADPKLRGIAMSGNAKVGLAAVGLLAVLLLIVRDKELDAQTAVLSPPAASSLGFDEVSRREAIPVAARRKPEAPKEHPTAKPPVKVEPVVAGVESPPLLDPPLLEPPFSQEEEPSSATAKITRKFTLEYKFDRRGSDARMELPDGSIIETELNLDHAHSITIEDSFTSLAPNADFERRIRGKWKTRMDLLGRYDGHEGQELGEFKATGKSLLDRRKLYFHYDPDRDAEADWQVSLKPSAKFDDSLLTKDLRADLSLAAFLPPDSVRVGEEWTVDGASLRDLLQPGGNLHVRFKTGTTDTLPPEGFGDTLLNTGALSGELRLVSSGRERLDDPRGSELEKFTAEMQLTLTYQNPVEPELLVAAGIRKFEHRIEFAGQGHGTWDVSDRFVAKLELAGDATIIQIREHLNGDKVEGRFRGTFEIGVETRR